MCVGKKLTWTVGVEENVGNRLFDLAKGRVGLERNMIHDEKSFILTCYFRLLSKV